MERFVVICPCCDANLIIDSQTGSIISHETKKKPIGDFEELKGDLEKKKQAREQLFAQEMSSVKDRERILEEKFQEAFKKADKSSDKPFRNPFDFD